MEVYALKVKSNKNVNVFVVETNIGDYQIHSDCIVKYGIKKGKVQDELFFEAIEESVSGLCTGDDSCGRQNQLMCYTKEKNTTFAPLLRCEGRFVI